MSAAAYSSMLGMATTLMQGVNQNMVDQAYNSAYKTAASKLAAANARSATEANISATNQRSLNEQTIIGMQQDQAEAALIVAAAASGTTGGSVDAGVYQTKANESFQVAQAEATKEQNTEYLLSDINSQSKALLAIDQPMNGPDPLASALIAGVSAFSSFAGQTEDQQAYDPFKLFDTTLDI